MADFLHRLINLVEQHGPQEAERLVRFEYGGTEVYIGKGRNTLAQQRVQALGAALRTAPDIKTACQQAGVPLRTGFRILRRPAKG